MIDTHTHLYETAFDPDGGGVAAVGRAEAVGVSHMVLPNVDASTVEPLLKLHRACPGAVSVAMGLHPTEVRPDWREVLAPMEEMLRRGGFVAVGEVGMDLYWDKTFRSEQMEAFSAQVLLAAELGLPVIIHCREALDEALEVLKDIKSRRTEDSKSPLLPPLVFHSFTLGREEVDKIREVAPETLFGINGVVTYKNAAALREAIPAIGLDHILLETDSPYLAPVPKRGRRNESALLPHILKAVAEAAGVLTEEAERITDANARALFSLPDATASMPPSDSPTP